MANPITVGYAFQTLEVGDKVATLTPSFYSPSVSGQGATVAFLTLEGGAVRYRYDGVEPTTLVGHLLQPGSTLTLLGQSQMSQFRAIRSTATSGSLSVTFERP